MISLQVYVPESHLESLKAALFNAGAGRIGNYDSCCWQTKGTGQFRPLENSHPYLGTQDKVEQVAEWKIELVCEDALLPNVIEALKAAHPYETPAYLVIHSADV